MGPRKSEDVESRPSSNFVHLSYKSLIDFENLRKTEDAHFLGILKMFSNYMLAATIGSYITAKSPLFQDRFGSIVVAGVLIVILANTPTMSKTQRMAEGSGAYFFGGCCITTILWWNFNMSFWVILRYFTGIALSGYLYSVPFFLLRIWNSSSSSSSSGNQRLRQKTDTNRMIFFLAGPIANFLGLWAMEPIFKLVFGVSYFLTPEIRMQVTVGCAIWFFLHGQFNFVKCRLYDRDILWQMIQLIPETFLALYFVPKSLFVNSEEDY
ncbi:hypothetical protein ACHWQZ_G009847 [Mnemiopsis leidyi]